MLISYYKRFGGMPPGSNTDLWNSSNNFILNMKCLKKIKSQS